MIMMKIHRYTRHLVLFYYKPIFRCAEFAIKIFKLFRHALVLVFSLFHWLMLSLKFRAGKYLRLNRKKYYRQNFEAIKYIKAFLCI